MIEIVKLKLLILNILGANLAFVSHGIKENHIEQKPKKEDCRSTQTNLPCDTKATTAVFPIWKMVGIIKIERQ